MGRNENTSDEEDSRLRSRIKKLLFESNVEERKQEKKPKRNHDQKMISETRQSSGRKRLLSDGVRSEKSGALAILTSKRDEVVLRHQQHPDEPLFESYEDYVAYMIDDDVDRPQYSTFVSMDEYNATHKSRILREDRSREFVKDEFEEDEFGSVDEYWRDSMDHILREEQKQEERSQENARKRQREWEERQRQREWEEGQQGYDQRKREQYQQHTTSNPFGDSVQDRISRNKQRLLNEFGLPTTASLDDVKKAYRDQMKQWHPDKYASKGEQAQSEATKKTQTLNESYQKILRQDFA